MTSRANHRREQNFDGNEPDGEELDLTTGKRLLAVAETVAWHLRRTVVFVPIFGVVFLAIGVLWLQDVREERSLKQRSDQLTILLDQPAPQPEILLLQAGGWDTAYRVVMDGRTTRPEDSDLIERVINAASDSGLVIVETGTTLDGVVTIENEDYTATPVLITAIGTISGIERYLALLETGEFAAFGIEALSIEEGLVGYQLSLRGLYYSLPENFGKEEPADEAELAITPIVPVEGMDAQ